MPRTGQIFGAVAAAAVLMFAGTGAAVADDVSITPQSMRVVAGASAPFTVQLLADNKGTAADPVPGCNATPIAPVTITFTAANSWASVSPTSVQVTDCTTVTTVNVTVAAGTASAAQTKVTGVASGGLQDQLVEVTTTGKKQTTSVDSGFTEDFVVVHVDAPATATPPPADTPPAPDADGDGIPDSEDLNSFAPAVGVEALDTEGTEGDTLATGGSFTDADDDSSLTLTVPAGTPGTFDDNGDGTFTWELVTDDDAEGFVTVTASDGEHADATQTFAYGAVNANPVVTAVTQLRVGTCAVTLGATFTDAGSADTHTTSVLWSDGSTDLDRTFSRAGSYDATVTVTDDDGGAGSKAVTGVRAFNTPSALMQPINATGARSGFKIGSTIPVKITVTGCDGQPVTNLTPAVNLVQGDTTPDVAVNEPVVSEVATNGKLMRWTDTQYVYNLSTKLSQFTGAALTQGTYTVSVSDPSFAAPAKAAFDLRK